MAAECGQKLTLTEYLLAPMGFAESDLSQQFPINTSDFLLRLKCFCIYQTFPA